PIQYADFAAWQREHLSGRVLEEQLAYWREHLGGAPAVLELPTDRPRPAVQSFRGARLNVTLPAELTARLKELGRAEGVTLFVVLLAGFKALLHRYTNQTDIVVGTPVANRNQLEVENLIGLFLNTLALRTNFDGAESFRQLLARVQDVLLGGYAHREVPFEKVVEALEPQRSLSHAPLFQVMFTLQNSSARQARSLGGLRMEPVETDEAGAKFDLNVMFEETGGALSGSFEYARDLFDAETIARMARHFEQLLASAVVSPERNVSELPLLSEDEERMLVAGWNDTARDYPQGVCLHQLFEAQAARTPERTALVADGRAMSYDELNARANRLARHLRLMGAGPERRVGVCLNRTAQLPVALLAVLKSGAAYVPLDPAYPQERLQFMLEDSDAAVLLTESALAGRFDVQESKLLCLDTKVAAVARLCPANPEAKSSDVNLAYVIYTSGSTGKPKGVALEHRRIVAFMRWARELYTDEELSGVLFSTSVCFDLSVYELFAPLSWGGTILLAENALQLPVLPEGTEIKLINTVPSAMAELVRLGLVPASARTVNLCGEALSGKLAREINAVETVERLYNLYGPTEDTV
ncbi:MAG TPA: condensation domain-containing protein, partial [Pyrinomonadaceae bacterium]|nr:condensation domain-containing protein [Pyrinomonadaceae bacterium]